MAASRVADSIAIGLEWTPFGHGFCYWKYPGQEPLPPTDEAGQREWIDLGINDGARAALRRTLAGQGDVDALLALLDRMLAEWREAGNGGGCGREIDLAACSSEPRCLDGIHLKKAVAFLS